MKHPRSRSERRHQRERALANRRFRWLYIWRSGRWSRTGTPDWGRYAKWNMGCGCMMCHSGKYFKEKRKRREALKRDVREAE